MKTIKQIADELGVSKQAVRNQIAKLSLQSSLRKNGNQFAIDEQQESAILQAFGKKPEIESQTTLQSETVSALLSTLRIMEHEIEFLRGQLEAKDEQIAFLQQNASNSQALHAGTIKHQLLPEAQTEKRRGFFGWLDDRKQKKKMGDND